MIIKTEKLHLIGVSFIICMAFTSCSDFLELKDLDQIVLENFWNEESDVENMIAGCYGTMQSQAFIDRAIIWGEARSENLDLGEQSSNDVNISNVMKENITPTNAYTTWTEYYDVINRCNTIQLYAPEVAQKDPNYTQYKLNCTIAEASALRDLCYFYLIRTFRDVPFSMQPYTDDTQRMDLPATPFNQVLDSLINDLERVVDMAVQYYPETKTNYQTGRITQDAIHAILADMYLWKQNWAKSVEHADMVIHSKLRDYQEESDRVGGAQSGKIDALVNGYPLVSDVVSAGTEYGKAFSSIFGTGNSSESVFELTFVDGESRLSNLGISTRYGSQDGGNGSLKPSDLVCNDHTSSAHAVFTGKEDCRAYENIYRKSEAEVMVAKYVSPNVLVDVTQSSYKATGQHVRRPKRQCYANWIFYRLSDVMLMKAEALAHQMQETDSGNLTDHALALRDEAFELVNAVSNRSNIKASTKSLLSKPTSRDAMINMVYDERNRELMFEGKRWFDLVRRSVIDGHTRYLVEKATRKHSAGNMAVAKSKLSIMNGIFWPYHEDELKVNGLLKQNPAYDTGEEELRIKN